jgi:hypothetical protein
MRVHFDRANMVRRGATTTFTATVARTHDRRDALQYEWGAEYRDTAELQRIVDQLPGLPIVAPPTAPYGHPAGLLLDNVPHRVIGRIDSAKLENDRAVVEMTVHDAAAIAAIDGGITEVSLGYQAATSMGFQRHTRVDHLAIVPKGNCGAACSITARVDACCDACEKTKPCMAQTPMHNSGLGDTIMDKDELIRQLNAQLAEVTTRADAATTELAAASARFDHASGEASQLKKDLEEANARIAANDAAVQTEAVKQVTTKLDEATAKIARFDELFVDRVEKRVVLERKAEIVLGPEASKFRGLTDRMVRTLVIKHLDASADVSDTISDGHLEGRFDVLTERRAATARSIARVSEVATQERKDAAAPVASNQLWLLPLPSTSMKGV